MTSKAQTQEDKQLREVKKHIKSLKKLFELLIKKYIQLLEGDEPLKASMYSEISNFLSAQGVSLQTMVNLNALEALRYADSSLKGELDKSYEDYLDSLSGKTEDTHDDHLPFGENERFFPEPGDPLQ